MIASVGSMMDGISRFSTRTSPGACMMTPRMVLVFSLDFVVWVKRSFRGCGSGGPGAKELVRGAGQQDGGHGDHTERQDARGARNTDQGGRDPTEPEADHAQQ